MSKSFQLEMLPSVVTGITVLEIRVKATVLPLSNKNSLRVVHSIERKLK